MFHAPRPNENLAIGRLEYVEVTFSKRFSHTKCRIVHKVLVYLTNIQRGLVVIIILSS